MRTLLIVEDNAEIRKQLKWGLSKEYTLLFADSSKAAIKLAENRGILTPGKLSERRSFADEIRTALADIDGIRALESLDEATTQAERA